MYISFLVYIFSFLAWVLKLTYWEEEEEEKKEEEEEEEEEYRSTVLRPCRHGPASFVLGSRV